MSQLDYDILFVLRDVLWPALKSSSSPFAHTKWRRDLSIQNARRCYANKLFIYNNSCIHKIIYRPPSLDERFLYLKWWSRLWPQIMFMCDSLASSNWMHFLNASLISIHDSIHTSSDTMNATSSPLQNSTCNICVSTRLIWKVLIIFFYSQR
jgi:hypothetical protein